MLQKLVTEFPIKDDEISCQLDEKKLRQKRIETFFDLIKLIPKYDHLSLLHKVVCTSFPECISRVLQCFPKEKRLAVARMKNNAGESCFHLVLNNKNMETFDGLMMLAPRSDIRYEILIDEDNERNSVLKLISLEKQNRLDQVFSLLLKVHREAAKVLIKSYQETAFSHAISIIDSALTLFFPTGRSSPRIAQIQQPATVGGTDELDALLNELAQPGVAPPAFSM
jgi:hypothetical protein